TISSLDDDLTIFVSIGAITESSEVSVINIDDDDTPIGMRELIDVSHAQEVLSGIMALEPSLRAPDAKDRLVERFIRYLYNDA
ncbi:MAG: hypothetical protein KDA87_27405, partial [Planctomycetales bacterium]|nr:hypothetical protein [Planctomycetales bacterium]